MNAQAVGVERLCGVDVADRADRLARDRLVVDVARAQVISPASTTSPSLQSTSQATRLRGSCSRQASRIESAMKSQTLSGWPSVTDSEVRM